MHSFNYLKPLGKMISRLSGGGDDQYLRVVRVARLSFLLNSQYLPVKAVRVIFCALFVGGGIGSTPSAS